MCKADVHVGGEMKEIIRRLEDIGAAREKLKTILEEIDFPQLSKHNPYYDSKDEEAAEKLDELRRKISYFEDKIYDVLEMLTIEPTDEE